jgi:hypothetical protein
MPIFFCNLCPLEDSHWLDSIIIAPYGVWTTSFFFPINWWSNKRWAPFLFSCTVKHELGISFIFLYNLVPNFWKFQNLKNLYFHFFYVQNKLSTCFKFLNSKELVIESRFFEGFFKKRPKFMVEIKSLMISDKASHTQPTPN